MVVTDGTKLDIVFKRVVYGVTETNFPGKGPVNENIASPLPVFGENVIAESALIPRPAPGTTSGVVQAYFGSQRIECIPDPTVPGGRAQIAVIDPTGDPFDPLNRLIDWIPPNIDPSYLARVYAGDPTGSGTRLFETTGGQEWIFDYTAGVLYFADNVPSGVVSDGVYIEGYRYIGAKGASGGGLQGEQLFNYTTASLAPGASEDFDLITGGSCLLLELTVSAECEVESFTTSLRNDSNPYRFVAIPGFLEDDGSYVIDGDRYFGPRFARLHNLENVSSGLTYWRITNTAGVAQSITLSGKVLRYL